MAHHKRGKPTSARAGCLMCKPQKHQGEAKLSRLKPNQQRKAQGLDADLKAELKAA